MNAVFQAADENILRAATWSGTPPLASYELETFERFLPSARVRYGSGSATVTGTIASAARGDLLVVPVTNADAGSGVLALTNGAGLNVAIPVPAMRRNGLPRTIVTDLTALASAGTRTSTSWSLVFTGNSVALTLGAAIAIYTNLHSFEVGDFRWGDVASRQAFGIEHENEYGTVYTQDHETSRRSVVVSKQALAADLEELEDWFDGCGGRFGSGCIWPDPDVNDGLLGRIVSPFARASVAPTALGKLYEVEIEFEEFSKGRPL